MSSSKSIIFTVDVDGGDWGWRTETTQGIDEGLPKIVELFEKYNITPIYFVAPGLPYPKGGRIGRHIKDKHYPFHLHLPLMRGHKFCKFPFWLEYLPYSSPKNHTSLLKHIWLHQPMHDIFYCHPFDIVRPKTKPPNLFCKLWYSQPERAYETLKNIVAKYS